MKTKAVRLYGKNDLRLEEFELPEIKDDEILIEVVTDSVCMSTYKECKLGAEHERVNDDIDINPIIVGHETAGVIRQVGSKWEKEYAVGKSISIQPAAFIDNSMATFGYSFANCGGVATYIIIPNKAIERGCIIPFDSSRGFYAASLSEPYSCIIGGAHAMYHTEKYKYEHKMGILDGGKCALLASCGPMGLGTIDYMLNGPKKPSTLVVTDINQDRIDRAKSIFSEEYARERGVEIAYVNTMTEEDAEKKLIDLNGQGGFDDVVVLAPVRQVIEMADRILGQDGCLSFFSGPIDKKLQANVNFYNVHYKSAHIMGTTGGNVDDMKECLQLSDEGKLNPAVMLTHIGGMDSVIDTTLNLPKIPGGKKIIYTGIDLELTAIDDFEAKSKDENNKHADLFKDLYEVVKENNFLWNAKAEQCLLKYFGKCQ